MSEFEHGFSVGDKVMKIDTILDHPTSIKSGFVTHATKSKVCVRWGDTKNSEYTGKKTICAKLQHFDADICNLAIAKFLLEREKYRAMDLASDVLRTRSHDKKNTDDLNEEIKVVREILKNLNKLQKEKEPG